MEGYLMAKFYICFKQFYIEELKFYNNLSNNNIIKIELEKYLNMNLKTAINYIKSKSLSTRDVEDIKEMYRYVLKLVITAKESRNEHNGDVEFDFEKLIME